MSDFEEKKVEEPVKNRNMAAIEAILFAMGDSVRIRHIAGALSISESEAREAVNALDERYQSEDSGLAIHWYEDAVQLSTKPKLYEYLIKIAKTPKKPVLTDTLLETLSIIAFKQPVTRVEVENIRGVNSEFAINKLISFDLIKEVGRKEAPGRPILFGTTEQFLRTFGIRSVDELPGVGAEQVEEFREEAEQEVDSRLEI